MFQLLFPLTIVSSAFVPTDAMPAWLRIFAEQQPVTAVVDASRALVLGASSGEVVATAAG